MAAFTLDRYVIDTLMPDLVGHDKQPSAFIVYLYLWSRGATLKNRRAPASLQQMSLDTGLSKSAVQQAIRTLRRRKLLTSRQASATSVPEYALAAPWRR
jgi:DNA-binding transcriptional MocR family regulator